MYASILFGVFVAVGLLSVAAVCSWVLEELRIRRNERRKRDVLRRAMQDGLVRRTSDGGFAVPIDVFLQLGDDEERKP